jgi:type VI secretion system ImpM family protein
MTTRSAFGALGKLRSEREFLRLHASDPAFLAFDEWLVDNMEWAARGAGEGWSSAYASGSVQAFSFRVPGPTPAVVAGALGPSADAAGREFPFSVLTRVANAPAYARAPQCLPLLLEELWQIASECVVDATQTAGEYLTERLARLYLPEPGSPTEAAAAYTEWTGSLALSDMKELLYGVPHEEASVPFETALRFIVDLVKPHRGVDHPKTPLSIRCPLGEAGGAAVCFWIDLVRRAARWKASLPSFFWSHDGGTGALLLHLGDPPKQTLAELWMPRGVRDEFCDLTLDIPPARTAYLSPLPRVVAELAGASGRPVDEFLDAFEGSLG